MFIGQAKIQQILIIMIGVLKFIDQVLLFIHLQLVKLCIRLIFNQYLSLSYFEYLLDKLFRGQSLSLLYVHLTFSIRIVERIYFDYNYKGS
ncbi:MAG: hypothetical protein ACI93S_000007 [Ancylomarina sp.]